MPAPSVSPLRSHTRMFGVLFTPEDARTIEQLARKEHRTLSGMVRVLVFEALKSRARKRRSGAGLAVEAEVEVAAAL